MSSHLQKIFVGFAVFTSLAAAVSLVPIEIGDTDNPLFYARIASNSNGHLVANWFENYFDDPLLPNVH